MSEHDPTLAFGDFVRIVETAGESADGFHAPRAERAEVDQTAGEGAARYGEITEVGARQLLRWLAPGPDDAFFDLGSGAGRFVVQAAVSTAVGRAVGIELSPWRDHCARTLLAAVCAELSEDAAAALRARTKLSVGDLRTADVGAATIAYIGATCFPAALLHAAAKHLAENAPRLHTLMTTQPLSGVHATRWTQRGAVDVPMSWSASEPVFIYSPRPTKPA